VSDRPGVVYAVENLAWPGWIKIGRAEGTKQDAESTMRRRLYGYNTGDPHRGYVVLAQAHTACCHSAERYAFAFLEVQQRRRGGGEWFRVDSGVVGDIVDKACHVARLAPSSRAKRFKTFLEEVRAAVDDTEKTLQEIADIEVRTDVAGTARAASQVIRDLLEQMAMSDENTEAAAESVLRRLDLLGDE